jgi:agmatinase
VITYFDQQIKERLFSGENWKMIVDEMLQFLPDHIYFSFDIDGLDPKLCPHTGMPVPGGFQSDEILYLIKRVVESGKKLIGFDLVEVGVGENNYDAVVAAKLLWKLCNLLVKSNCPR